MTRKRLLFLLLALGLIVGFSQTPAWPQEATVRSAQAGKSPTTVASITDALNSTIHHELVQQFALCELRAAWWGGYDVTVHVGASATRDGQPRVFKISKGQFSQSPDPNSTGGLAEVQGSGPITFATKEAAFAKGVPFFISDAKLKSRTELSYTVHSNPNITEKRVVYSTEGPYEQGFRTSLHLLDPLSSNPEPQTRTFKFDEPLDPKLEQRFMLVTLFGNNNRCRASNTIDLKALLNKLPPE
jgi:hypothetical protein